MIMFFFQRGFRRCNRHVLLVVHHEPQSSELVRSRCLHSSNQQDPSIKKTRNIGIIAHVDAGKTTTTERMLYYSGFTRRIGDVNDGSTVTDFLPAERTRGITIQAAAVSFQWPPLGEGSGANAEGPRSHQTHTINLIDTPGHADFTFEVIRTMRILDGAVCILDGVAGVEAQTEKVWSQANGWSIPRIVFVNKLDRDGASFAKTVKEIGSRLKGFPAVCQIPWWEGGKGRFTGVADAVNLCAMKWEEGDDGKHITTYDLESLAAEEPDLTNELVKARSALVEALCEHDEQLLETWLECNDESLAIPAQAIKDSLRRCIFDGSGRLIPVFAGASFRNIGVQPLLDAVNDLLPDPTERPDPQVSFGDHKTGGLSEVLSGNFDFSSADNKQLAKKGITLKGVAAKIEGCALAFKVVNDPKRGVLVYVRVYSGAIDRNTALWNSNLQLIERPQRLLQMQASDAVEIPHILAGQIGVIAGLKYTRTGDTLISYDGLSAKTGPPTPVNTLQLQNIQVPPPVFFAAIEPTSLSDEKAVEHSLDILLREDPSLHRHVDKESGQVLLSGMGELHLEIARDRLVNDFKARATMGDIDIGYRECVLSKTGIHRYVFDREVAGKIGKAGCQASVGPLDELAKDSDYTDFTVLLNGNAITIEIPCMLNAQGKPILPLEITVKKIRDYVLTGAVAAISRGPRRSFPLHSTHVIMTFNPQQDYFGPDTSNAALSAAAKMAVQSALQEALAKSNVSLMEPVMNVVISCDESTLGSIVHDLSSARGGHILSLENDGNEDLEDIALQPISANKIYAPPDPFASTNGVRSNSPGQQRQISARVPLKEMIGYLKHLRSLTGGRGTFIMTVDKFERLSGPREKLVK